MGPFFQREKFSKTVVDKLWMAVKDVFSTMWWKTCVGNVENLLRKREQKKEEAVIMSVVKCSAIADVFNDILDCALHFTVLGQLDFHLLGGVDHCGAVAPAELLANGLHGHLGDFAGNVHCYLAGVGDIGGTFGRTDIRGGGAEGARDFLNNFFTVWGQVGCC